MSEVLTVGDVIDVVVEDLQNSERVVRVSRRELLEHPFDAFRVANPEGSEVPCQVTEVLDRKANVRLPGGLKGFITIGDVAWETVSTVDEVLSIGDEFRARVVGFEPPRSLVRLSRKQLLPKPLDLFKLQQIPGSVISGLKVKNLANNAAWIDLGRGVEGRIHVSRLGRGYVAKPEDVLRVHQDVTVRVIGFNERSVELELVSVAAPIPTSSPNSARPVPTAPAIPSRPTARAAPPPVVPVPVARSTPRGATGFGPTIAVAIEDGCRKLGVATNSITYTVITEPKIGLFGRVKTRAVVRVVTK